MWREGSRGEEGLCDWTPVSRPEVLAAVCVSGCRPVLPSPLPNNPTPGAPGGGPRPVGRWGRLIWDVTG